MLPTIADVAKLANVSTATVSRVINQNGNVASKTGQQVTNAMRQLNYFPNKFARGLAGKQADGIGVVIQDFADPYFGMILRGIEGVTKGYNLQITVASGNRSSKDELSAIEFLRQQKYNVVILSNSHVPENKLLELTEQGIQFIHIGQYVSTFAEHCICIDDEQGAELATGYLIDQGHRYIAHIAFPEFHEHTVSRLNGFRRTLEKANIAYSEQLVVSPKGFDQTSAYEATEQLLGRNEAFTAIFASTDIMAIGAYKALRQAGLSVPEDVSVVGYDDVDVAAFAYPPLTTIRQPIQEMSEAAAHLAISYLKGYSAEKEVVPRFSPQLVVRDSVNTPK